MVELLAAPTVNIWYWRLLVAAPEFSLRQIPMAHGILYMYLYRIQLSDRVYMYM